MKKTLPSYVEAGHYIAFNGEIYISSEALISRLKMSGIDATRRTLNFYRSEGLISDHRRFSNSKKRFYPEATWREICGLRVVNKLLGWSLKDILAIKKKDSSLMDFLERLNPLYQDMLNKTKESTAANYFNPMLLERMRLFSMIVKSAYKGSKDWEKEVKKQGMPKLNEEEIYDNKHVQELLEATKGLDNPVFIE